MNRLTLCLLIAAATLLIAAVFTRPLACLVSTEFAVYMGAPVRLIDLGMPESSLGERGSLHVDALDPWGQPYRWRVDGPGYTLYTSGPDGVDEGGPGAGDDVALLSDHTFGSTTLYRGLTHAPWTLGLLALAAAWLAVLTHTWGRPRSPSPGVEAARAGVLALLPTALAAAWVFTHPDALEALEPLTQGLLVPLPVAVSAGSGFVLFLAALRLRLTRPLPPDAGDPPPLPWRRILLAALLVLSLLSAAVTWGLRSQAHWEQVQLEAKAQLGIGGAIKQLIKFGSDAQLQHFLAHAPTFFDFGDLSDPELTQLAAYGPVAAPALLTVIRDGEHGGYGLRTVALDFVRDQPQALDALAEAITDQPQDWTSALLFFSDDLLPRFGRRALIDRLLLHLDDTADLETLWNQYQPRRCDSVLQSLTGMTLPDCPVAAPSVIDRTPTHADWDAAIADFRTWWATGPALSPRCWIELSVVRLPASEAQPLDLNVRYGLGAEGFLGASRRVDEPRVELRQALRAAPLTVTVGALSADRISVSVDPPPRDSTIRLEADWAHPDEVTTRVVEHPR